MVYQKALELLFHADAIKIGGKYEIYPNTFSPIMVDFRKLLNRPRDFDLLTDLLADAVKSVDPDKVVGAFTSGIPLATAVSLKTNLPMAFVRREPKELISGSKVLEGELEKGERIVIVDDVFSTLKNNEKYLQNLSKFDVEVVAYTVIFDYMMTPREKLAAYGIEVESLLNAKELLNKLEKWGKITKDQKQEYLKQLKFADSNK